MELNAAEIGIEHKLTNLYDQIVATRFPYPNKPAALQKIRLTNDSIHTYFEGLYYYFNQTNAGQVIFKNAMCKTDNGISPFWKVNPGPACKLFLLYIY
jgi:hypothetical protein